MFVHCTGLSFNNEAQYLPVVGHNTVGGLNIAEKVIQYVPQMNGIKLSGCALDRQQQKRLFM